MTKAMKDSGVDWIGKIPEDWCVRRLKVLAKLQTGNTPPKENSTNIYYTDEGFLWVKPDNLYGFNPIKNTNEHLNEEGYQIAKVAPAGAPLVCCIGTIGKYGVSDQDVAYNQQINAVIFNDRMDKKFGLYHISCQEEQHWFYANGNVVQILNTQNQGKILLSCPPIQEQQKIADYLDKKCGEIDKVVETEKAVIEKLKEYKQSIITEAVTKGLDKSVPFKDSGIEWIGKIPAHWEVCKIKYLAEIKGRIGFKGYTVDDLADAKEEGCAVVLGGTNIMKEGYISYDKLTYLKEYKYLESPEIMLHGGEILITKVGAGTGDNAIYKYYQERVTINPNVMLCVPKDKKSSNFINYFLLSPISKTEVLLESTKSGAQPAINQQFIKNHIITLPPVEEQQQIADYLDKKCSEIDKAISDKEKVIEKFIEYKKSLIYECVTGKKEMA